ncbi:hypothetical protein EB73_29320 [Mycobacterium sp. SWH-M3]|nr:hypothetical protein EB73_29320 [Mycobacterium sp. SWH-M3]
MMANNPRWSEVAADANQARAAASGQQQAALARRALDVLQAQAPMPAHMQRWIEALQHRIDHPDAALAELGQSMTPPLTKNAYAALLRRAFRASGVTDAEQSKGD